MNAPFDIKAILEDFELLDDWDDRYRYLIELGSGLEPLAPSEKTPQSKVQGCVSQVWLVCESSGGPDPVLTFRGDSDAHIVRGLIAVTLALFSGRRASQIVATDEADVFGRLRLTEHITPQRSNGLRAVVARIKAEAAAAAGQPAHSAGR
ncbi:MAG: cysteine desufuration protein SufE [Alphaproteobacteria bacterium]|nr:MAG: cysteine desufuration protein SufE [Alphaproteobacteria bacterium]